MLAAATDPQGRKLQLVVLPEPEEPRIKTHDFVSSYVNYYVCNGAVIAGEFGDEEPDEEAEEILHTLY
ncbi:MAG: agmatine deiminase family protein, partial [Ottowia sp.]|nr:agmatine deiminase family protein [Ottowia sp.]